jgi:hypothetical protein
MSVHETLQRKQMGRSVESSSSLFTPFTPKVDAPLAATSQTATPQTVPEMLTTLQRSPSSEPVTEAVDAIAQASPHLFLGHDFSRISIRPKLTISQPDDPYEQEADRVADEVMRMPISTPKAVQNHTELEELQRQPLAASIPPLIQRDEATSIPPLMQPSDPATRYPIDLGLRFELDPEFNALLQQHVDQQLDPSVVKSALSQINFNLPSPMPGPISPPAPPTLPPTSPSSPIVPRGAGPQPARPGKPEDILEALAKIPEIDRAIKTLKEPVLQRGKKFWNNLGAAGKVSTVVSVSSATLGFAVAELEVFRQAFAPLNGQVISLPGLEWFGLEGNLAGTNIMVGLHVDVGKLLPANMGFGSASFKAIGSAPSPQPLELGGTSVQRSPSPAIDTATDTNIQVGHDIENRLSQSRSGGTPLPSEIRTFMEPRFGTDFSRVRVHTDSAAVQLNRELGAQAFAYGSDIYFGAGKSAARDHLTAHELTHVVQQTGGTQTKLIQNPQTVQPKCLACQKADVEIQRSPALPSNSTEGAENLNAPFSLEGGFCQPFASQEEARNANLYAKQKLLPFLKEKYGSEVGALWESYLSRKLGDSLQRHVFLFSGAIAKGFATSEVTAQHQIFLLNEIERSIQAKCPAAAANTMTVIPLSNLLPNDILNDPINFNRIREIPGNIAGGVGSSDAGLDSRQVSGEVRLYRRVDDSGNTLDVSITTNFIFTVRDAIDFCPGDPGSDLEQGVTTLFSRLEASGFAYDVPFEVKYEGPVLEKLLDPAIASHCWSNSTGGTSPTPNPPPSAPPSKPPSNDRRF